MPLEAFILIAVILTMLPVGLADWRDNNRK